MAVVAEKTIGADDPFIGRQPSELAEAEYQSDVRKLVDLLSKLNPAAEEFFPSNYAAADSAGGQKPNGRLSADAPVFEASSGFYKSKPISNGSSSMESSSDGSSNSQPNCQVISFSPYNFVLRSFIYFCYVQLNGYFIRRQFGLAPKFLTSCNCYSTNCPSF